MIDSLSKPKRRRWIWAAVALGIGAAGLGMVLRSNEISRRTHAWLLEASQGTPLVIQYNNVCIIPGLRQIPILRKLLTHRQIHVSAIDEENVEKLLSMPPCPVILKVETNDTISVESFIRLREQFGKEAVR